MVDGEGGAMKGDGGDDEGWMMGRTMRIDWGSMRGDGGGNYGWWEDDEGR